VSDVAVEGSATTAVEPPVLPPSASPPRIQPRAGLARPVRAPEVVERALAVFLAVWWIAWIGVDPAMWPGATAFPLLVVTTAGAWLCLVVVVLGAFGIVPVRWGSLAAGIAVALLVVAAGLRLWLVDTDAANLWPSGVAVASVAVGTAALRMRTRTASWVVPAVAAILVVQVLVASSTADLGAMASDAFLFGLYVLTLGVICLLFAALLRRSARATAVAHELVLRTATAVEAEDSVRRDVAAHERALHDTVLNTLNAVARGELEGHEGTVRRWCARAADEIRSLSQPGAGPAGDLSDGAGGVLPDALRRVPAPSIPVRAREADLRAVPEDVRAALVTATAEALRNTGRHSEATHVSVDSRRSGSGVTVVVRDDGSGFDVPGTPPGLGLTRSVRGVMEQVGGRAEIVSEPGEGTTVTLTWAPGTTSLTARRLAADVTDAVRRVAPVLLVPSAVLAMASLLVSLPMYEQPGLAVGAFALWLAVATALVIASLRGRIGWVLTLATAVATPLIHDVEEAAHTAEPGLWSSWSSEALLALLIVVVLAGPRWGWPVALASWWATQDFKVLEFVQPGGALLVTACLFAIVTRREARRYEEAVAEAAMLQAHLEGMRESERRSRSRYRGLAATALPLLVDLADGTLDAADPQVRLRCREEERYARSLVRVDPEWGPVHGLATRLVELARDRGVVLDADIRDDLPAGYQVEAARLARVEQQLGLVVAALPRGPSEPRLTAGAEPGGVVVRLVAAEPSRLPPTPDLLVDVDADEGQALWEAVLPHVH
jgi:Histidine kinase-, DNA gyrase B-, and HSP90-like ATPase